MRFKSRASSLQDQTLPTNIETIMIIESGVIRRLTTHQREARNQCEEEHLKKKKKDEKMLTNEKVYVQVK